MDDYLKGLKSEDVEHTFTNEENNQEYNRSAETNNSIDKVISQLSELIKLPGNEDEVIQIINLTGKDLFAKFARANSFDTSNNSDTGLSQSLVTSSSSFNDSVDIALYVKDEEAACIALAGYTGSVLNEDNIYLIFAIQQQYGVKVLIQILKQWLHLGEIFMLMPFIANFLREGGAKEAVYFMIQHKIKTFTDEYASVDSFYYTNYQFLDVFKACNEIGDLKSQDLFAKFITAKNCRSKSELVDIFLILKSLNPTGFTPLRLVLTESIKTDFENMLSQGLWHNNDNYNYHSFCRKCISVQNFMKSNNETLTISSYNGIRHLQAKFNNRPLRISTQGTGKNAVIIIKKDQSIYQINEQKLKALSNLLVQLEQAAIKTEFVDNEKMMGRAYKRKLVDENDTKEYVLDIKKR